MTTTERAYIEGTLVCILAGKDPAGIEHPYLPRTQERYAYNAGWNMCFPEEVTPAQEAELREALAGVAREESEA